MSRVTEFVRAWPLALRAGAAAFCLLGAASLRGQATPAGQMKPSAAVSTLPAAQPTSAAQTAAKETPVVAAHSEVTFADGSLSVVAVNASLNEILREIEQKTGIKITGGVTDERVFGSYGPAPAAKVLAALLDGTESNMLLVDGAGGRSELILTPRHGGATPPSPNAEQASAPEEPNEGQGAYVPPPRQSLMPVRGGRGPGGGAEGGVPGQTDPSGPRSAQQIYEQLQRNNRVTPPNAPQ